MLQWESKQKRVQVNHYCSWRFQLLPLHTAGDRRGRRLRVVKSGVRNS